MAKRAQFLIVDIGSIAVHMAEFESMPNSTLRLHAFDSIEYPDAITEENRQESIAGVVRRALASGKYKAKVANLCVSGQAAFMRFVKLPPVSDDESSVRQIVQFEARQNVPFPIDEVVWDYQLIGNEEDEDELEVMFAVIKNDIVNSVVAGIRSAGLKPKIVDFSPAALYNAARANYIGENECSMLLDIGGKCTTLLFLEGGRFFARCIPIAGASITQQIGKEFNISVEEAEILKRRYGFVALGGAYEEPESEVAATISKIIRNVMTKLHGEINRTINIYRSQQKGSKPVKLFLAGGSSTMAFTEHFFSEKLRMEVSYFNAFNIITFADHVDRDALSQLAHLFPNLVGVALRSVHHCPVEINLATNETRDGGSSLKGKLPTAIACCGVLIASLLCILGVNYFRMDRLQKTIETQTKLKQGKEALKSSIEKARRSHDKAVERYNAIKKVLSVRSRWNEFLNVLQDAKPLDAWLVSVEQTTAPTNSAEPERKEQESEKRIFGGLGRRRRATTATKQQSSGGHAEWFLIRGYTVKITEDAYKDDQDLGPCRPIFHQEQVETFKHRLSAITSADKSLNKNTQLPFLGPGNSNFVTVGPDLPETFEKSLRFMDYFDEKMTAMQTLGKNAGGMRNVTAFTIRLHLSAPIPLTR